MSSNRRVLLQIAFCGLVVAGFTHIAGQTPSGGVYVVTHVDIAGTPEIIAEATKLLREFSADSRKDPGAVRFELLLQDGRLNHFTIVSVWKTREAFEAHTRAEARSTSGCIVCCLESVRQRDLYKVQNAAPATSLRRRFGRKRSNPD
jgi:quinol monooxygenase YgiN